MKNIKPLIIFLFFSIFLQKIHAQELYSVKEKADDAYDHMEFAKALPLYQKLVGKNERSRYSDRIAISLYRINDFKGAIPWLKKALLIYPQNEILRYYYADAIDHQGNYVFALSQYQFFTPSSKEMATLVDLKIKSCKEALRISLKPAHYSIKNDSVFNSGNSEFAPSLTHNGILFASDRPVELPKKKNKIYGWTNTHFLNLFISNKSEKGKYDVPKLFSADLASEYHTAAAVLSPDQKTIYFTRTEYIRNPTKVFKVDFKNNAFINRLEIFYSTNKNGKWSNPNPFPYNKSDEFSVGHPAISLDGKTLYFASDMPGGKGGVDIYSSTIEKDGQFGKPVNLGDSINTAGNEEFPVIGLDNNLYFSSDGLPGLGGLDIFKSTWLNQDKHWTHPENLGVPLNSAMDDFSLVTTDSLGRSGFFSSNRSTGKGADDIYDYGKIELPLNPADTTEFFSGKILNAESGKGILGAELLINQASNHSEQNSFSDSTGSFKFQRKQNENYIIRIKKSNYFTKFDTLGFNKKGELVKGSDSISLVPIIVNKPIRLENIYYDFNSWTILPQAAHILDGLVKVLKDNPEISIDLDSHTDSRGDRRINKFISEKRAESAVEYIISQGIIASRLKPRGFGKERPLIRCDNGHICTEEDHQLNRRTEFSVTKILQEN